MAEQKRQDVIVDNGAVYVLRSGTSVYMKTADICALTGKSNQWIGQLTNQGTLAKKSTPHGTMYELKQTIRTYCEALEAKRDKDQNKELEKNRQIAEASLKASKARIAKIEADELSGKMHRAEDVAAITSELVYTVRGMLMALPGRLAVDTANAGTAAETAKIIERETYKIMEELSQFQYNAEKYEDRVRERRKWERVDGQHGNDEES